MKKNLLKEFILPAFWLFCFIVSSIGDDKMNTIKKTDNTQVKQQDVQGAGAGNGVNKNKESIFTKAIFLSGF